jgi:transcriptional regulator with XRE-family HTH domain
MDICAVAGQNIRHFRKQKRLSQEELAFRAHIDRAYLSQVENGKRNITLLVLAELASALDVEPAELLVVSKEQ